MNRIQDTIITTIRIVDGIGILAPDMHERRAWRTTSGRRHGTARRLAPRTIRLHGHLLRNGSTVHDGKKHLDFVRKLGVLREGNIQKVG